MKCVSLEAQSYVMIGECGGAVLQKGQVIVVQAEIAERMMLQYKVLKSTGVCEMERLKGGHYQVGGASAPEPKETVAESKPAPEQEPVADEPAVSEKKENKSLFGKKRVKRK